jgi:hypothetical protein
MAILEIITGGRMSIISWIKKQVERKPANCRRADWTDEDEDEDDCCDEEAEQEAHDRGEEDRERLERLLIAGDCIRSENVSREVENLFLYYSVMTLDSQDL